MIDREKIEKVIMENLARMFPEMQFTEDQVQRLVDVTVRVKEQLDNTFTGPNEVIKESDSIISFGLSGDVIIKPEAVLDDKKKWKYDPEDLKGD